MHTICVCTPYWFISFCVYIYIYILLMCRPSPVFVDALTRQSDITL